MTLVRIERRARGIPDSARCTDPPRRRPHGRVFASLVAGAVLAMLSVPGIGASSGEAELPDWASSLPLQLVARRRIESDLPQSIHRFMQTDPLASVRARLEAGIRRAPGAGELLVRDTGGWQVLSVWQQRRLFIVQLRQGVAPGTEGLLTVTDFNAADAGSVARSIPVAPTVRGAATVAAVSAPAPPWLPVLLQPWRQHWEDETARVSTVMGWFPGSLGAAESAVVRAGGRTGLVVAHRAQVPGRRQGLVLVLAGAGAELMITLEAHGGRTGVVAHLTEPIR